MPADSPGTTVLDVAQLRIAIRRGEGLPVAQPRFPVRLHADDPPPAPAMLVYERPGNLVARPDALLAGLPAPGPGR